MSDYYDEITRAVLIAAFEENVVISWPDTRKVSIIAAKVEQLMEPEDDGQPDWEQEWYDFGERYE